MMKPLNTIEMLALRGGNEDTTTTVETTTAKSDTSSAGASTNPLFKENANAGEMAGL